MTHHPRARHARGRAQLLLFAAVYLLYLGGRWATGGDMQAALAHADWVMDFERGSGIFVERAVQRALDGGVAIWLLSNVYLAAQLVVVPGTLLWLYRAAPAVYRRLRDTVIARGCSRCPSTPCSPPRRRGWPASASRTP